MLRQAQHDGVTSAPRATPQNVESHPSGPGFILHNIFFGSLATSKRQRPTTASIRPRIESAGRRHVTKKKEFDAR
jgi:hypothetical protein